MQELRYLAPVWNVNTDVLKVNLPRPFSFEKWSVDRVLRLVEVEEPAHAGMLGRFAGMYASGNAGKLDAESEIVVITGTMLISEVGTSPEEIVRHLQEVGQRESEIERPLIQALRLLRLITNAQFFCPVTLWYLEGEEGSPWDYWAVGGERRHWPDASPFYLSDHAANMTNMLIEQFATGLNYEYLQLALDHFAESFDQPESHFQFVSLMVAAEALFNDGPVELRYRIARAAGVVAGGGSRRGGEEIFDAMKKLYDRRSKLVHTGRRNVIEERNVTELRNIVRRSLGVAISADLSKTELLSRITATGFGSRFFGELLRAGLVSLGRKAGDTEPAAPHTG